MTGKILKISSNNLDGKYDDRKVIVFACFEDIKYMNNYVIFCFEDELEKKKLYYGSVHLKDNSLVIFSVKSNIETVVLHFVLEYLNSKIDNFKLIDIGHTSKVELVSYNMVDSDDLNKLYNISIKIENKSLVEIEKETKPIFLYFIIILLILFSIGITLLYFFPNLFYVKNKQLVCKCDMYDQELLLNYEITKDIKFDEKDNVLNIKVFKEYIFLDSDSYYEFKNNNMVEQYFNNGETYKFIDDSLKFKLMYEETSVIDEYDEMLVYLKREGFNCIEREYEK